MKRDHLFDLIKSLSKSEKRYFRLFCNQTAATSNYQRVFDAVEEQEEYDEQAIRKKFKGASFLKQLHVTKNYLRRLILKSLRNYHQQISPDAMLKSMLRNVEILFHKELYELCRQELKRAEAFAGKAELYTGLVEVRGWQRKLAQTLQPNHYQRLSGILEKQAETLELLQNTQTYWQIAVNTSATFVGEAQLDISNKNWVNNPEQAKTTEAKVLYFNTMYLHFLRQNQSAKGADQLQQLLSFLEANPERIAGNLGVYLSTLHNLVSFFVYQEKQEQVLELLQRGKTAFELHKQKNENSSLLKQMLRGYNIELELYRSADAHAVPARFITEVKDFVEHYRLKMPEDYRLSFWFQFAYIAFSQMQFDEALKWINRILNGKWKQARQDLQVQARMLNLMIHLEQQNLFVLRYFVDSTRRFYKKVKTIHPFEKTLLQFFAKIGRVPAYEYKDHFQQLQAALFPTNAAAQVPKDVRRYIDYQRWIASKI